MEKKSNQSAASLVNEIKRKTRRKFSSEEKIRIVVEGMRGEESIVEICRKYSIHTSFLSTLLSLILSTSLIIKVICRPIRFTLFFL